ncbi:glucose-6-phosphate isomerase [Ornithinibacillus sp. 4-3]|uniref:Glucose-6-phosphate isomerase n=1 Tax=Ornithinibacillus sp. 4-3 TaxID=3231488 RepID=A0AB39HJ88_9BACI
MTKEILKTTMLNCSLDEQSILAFQSRVREVHDNLPNYYATGWVDSPLEDNKELLKSINYVANEIKACADVLVVIGVGGSFLGARAIQEALTPYFGLHKNGIEVVYVGLNMSGAYIRELLAYLDSKQVYVNVISKSGGTMEPALAFRVMRLYMEERYGDKAAERIIVTTDAEKGILKNIADQAGYRQFAIPDNVGGRYSVLTPVGLLPVAVAGIDIIELMDGAKRAATELAEPELIYNDAYQYAVMRHILFAQGYTNELLASFEPGLSKFHEWWKQLFGESEGKDRKGLFPSTVSFSTDLHAIGQYIQDGRRILFETLLHFHEIEGDMQVPFDERNEDGLNYLTSRTFNEINAISKQGTALAHAEGEVPVIQLELPKLDAYHLGYLIYFFMKACAMSACLLEVDPFDQPGVEAYKRKMLELLQEEKEGVK